jgi:phosphopantothenoylcysteine decarboxylase/phosphopantothenate--cysteine ligase
LRLLPASSELQDDVTGEVDPSVLAGRRVLLGVSGGIAAYKSALLARLLVGAGAEVQVVMTPAATRFVGPDTFAALTRRAVHSDVFERTDVVLHVRLAHQAELAVVAPATANVVAKLALGLADDLLTSTLLEATCPLIVAPAMHTGMWEHPATQANLRTLAQRGVVSVGPASGPLAAGDEGVGRMAEPEEIFQAILGTLGDSAPSSPTEDELAIGYPVPDLRGRRVLVTAGPTFEPIDPVRFIGNRSSGKMGFQVAEEAAAGGAQVTLVAGPVAIPDPPGVEVIRVETAEEMGREVLDRYTAVDAVVMAAAVADWRPNEAAPTKLKKDAGPPKLKLQPTTDILATLGKRKEGQVLVGFAAEATEDPEREGRRKMVEKNLDMLVANVVGRPRTGFGTDTNRAAILTASGEDVPLRDWTKSELAFAICDRLASLLSPR